MASTKEIRSKIASVENTQKITSAMEMVATSKMRHSQESMNAAKPYNFTLRRVISHIAKAKPNSNNPFIKEKECKKVCFMVISTDRGLCGGLNINLFKKVLNVYAEYHSQNIEVEFAIVGAKALAFFQSMGVNISFRLVNIGDKPDSEITLGFAQGVVDEFLNNTYDRVLLFTNKFVNTMVQEPRAYKFLPLPTLESQDDLVENLNFDYIYEGDSSKLLHDLINRYIESQIHKSILESLACEQAARMIAMKAATDNASTMIDELKLAYNKARQTSITNELNEIVAGAAAV